MVRQKKRSGDLVPDLRAVLRGDADRGDAERGEVPRGEGEPRGETLRGDAAFTQGRSHSIPETSYSNIR